MEDIAQAIADFSLLEKTDSREYNLGSTETVTILELASRIHKQAVAMGLRDGDQPLRFLHSESPKGDVRTAFPSIDRVKNELGWQPHVSLDQALERCIRETLQDQVQPS